MTCRVIVWALVSRSCRETVELYLDKASALRDLAAALRDEPDSVEDLDVVPLDFGAPAKGSASLT